MIFLFNRSLNIALLQIYFNITKLLRNFEKKWPPSSPRLLSQSECRIQQKYYHILEKKATHPMRMQDFQSQQHHMVTKAMRMQNFQSQQNYMLKKKATQPMSMQNFQSQQNYMLKKKATQPMSMQDSNHNKATCCGSVAECWQSITCYWTHP